MAGTVRYGEAMVNEGLITLKQLETATQEQKKTNERLGSILVRTGAIKDRELMEFLERFYQIPAVDLSQFEIDKTVSQMIPREICEKHCVVPISKAGNTLVVAFSEPGNMFVKDDLGFLTRCRIQVVIASESSITATIDKCYGGKVKYDSLSADMTGENEDEFLASVSSSASAISDDADADAGPIVKFVNTMLGEAIRKGASDIHVEPYEKRFRIRYRVDGNLIEQSEPPSGVAAAVTSRIKIMSKLDIAEKRRPQDGRLKVRTQQGKEIDFRVSVLPTLFGEKVVLRILDKSNLQLDMTKLGFEPEDLKMFQDAIHLPQGMVLLTGPTGSGKTTTIYSALQELNQIDVNICTAEDPVEFNLEGINQVQMNHEIDLNFASALRSFLRQDPDIVMVGEMRDYETAEIGFKAAATGHLVVSTLHTNDAPSTVARLIDIGVAPYMVTSTVSLIVAQRLVGKNCEHCKEPVSVPADVLVGLGVDPSEVSQYKLMKGKGCTYCNGTGIKGRIAIYELMKITDPIKELILTGGTAMQLRQLCREQGLKTLRRSALLKLMRGQTSISEVINSSVKDI